MRLALIALALVLTACESALDAKSDSEILNDYKAYQQRLDSLAFPILKANADLCPRRRYDNGARWHRLGDYPKPLRASAKAHFGFSDEQDRVFFVRTGGAADTAGLKPGDERTKASALAKGDQVCGYAVQIRFEADANAYASGDAVIITSGLMRSLDDDALSLVIAHELAHNVLGHASEAVSAANERQADRYAVYFLARAGLDYKRAVRSRAATDQPHRGRTKPLKNSETRRQHFERVIDEVDKLVADGKPLLPQPKD